jgi:hypothetical protein
MESSSLGKGNNICPHCLDGAEPSGRQTKDKGMQGKTVSGGREGHPKAHFVFIGESFQLN